jgi:hypothetical protein
MSASEFAGWQAYFSIKAKREKQAIEKAKKEAAKRR